MFIMPMVSLTLKVASDYAKHRKLCRCTVFTYFVLTLAILAVAGLEGKMLYDARTSMKNDIMAPCAEKENSGLLGRFEGYDNRARELFCSEECPCNLAIPYPKGRVNCGR